MGWGAEPDYARLWMGRRRSATAEAIDASIRERMARQRILHRRDGASFTFFVHEQALLLTVGSDAVRHEQLLHLVHLAALPNVTPRVLPASASTRSMFGGFSQPWSRLRWLRFVTPRTLPVPR